MAQTMSELKLNAYRDWQNESDARKKALKEAEPLPGEPIEAFEERVASMPQPRTWFEFARDPLEDGAPTSPDSDEPGMLDPRDPLNTDSLFLEQAWAKKTPGTDMDKVYFYKQSQKGRQNLSEKISEFIYPSIVHKTAAADYVPALWNPFQKKDGSRYEGHHVENFALRSGFHMAGALWNLLMGIAVVAGGAYALKKAIPNLLVTPIETVDEAIDEIQD